MITRTYRLLLSMTMLMLAALACGLPSSTPAPVDEPPTKLPTLVAVTSDSSVAPTSPPQSIPHVDVPGELPLERTGITGDHESFITSPEKRAPGGDRFTFGRYERPFNANAMDVYLPHLDITETSSYQDASWIYFEITLRGRDTNHAFSGNYGIEIDSDADGHGDWLLTAAQPASSDWSTDGVEVWFDSNNDVGGSLSVTSDDQGGGNGYDGNLFDRGQGDDADLAWARIPTAKPFTIQLAIKASLLGDDDAYMAGAWAGNDLLDPALFDLNDRFTHEQAGSSLVEFEIYYPIKAVAEIDNTCRVAIGFQPSGGEPGLCTFESQGGSCTESQKVCVDTIYGPQCRCPKP